MSKSAKKTTQAISPSTSPPSIPSPLPLSGGGEGGGVVAGGASGRGSKPLSDTVIARRLIGEIPLSHRRFPDGSMVIIDHTGRKLHFTPDQVAAVL